MSIASTHPSGLQRTAWLQGIPSLAQWDDTHCPVTEVRSYARFKLGAVEPRDCYLLHLAYLVAGNLASAITTDFDRWILVTPATTELAVGFAGVLQQILKTSSPMTVRCVGPDPHPDSDYTGCTATERMSIVESFYDFDFDTADRKILIIDDMLNTGTAIQTLAQRLCRHGSCWHDLHPYVFVRGRFKLPERERGLVSEVIEQISLTEIIAILRAPEHYFTSATMLKYLACRSRADLQQIASCLPAPKRKRLRAGVRNYYRNHPLPQNLSAAFGLE